MVTIDGNPWFVAIDTLRILGLTNTTMALRILDAGEVQPIPFNLIAGKGMNQAKLISESGLYKLIMRSDKPEAKPFQDWVTKVVLPAIRKDGANHVMEAIRMPRRKNQQKSDRYPDCVLRSFTPVAPPLTTTQDSPANSGSVGVHQWS